MNEIMKKLEEKAFIVRTRPYNEMKECITLNDVKDTLSSQIGLLKHASVKRKEVDMPSYKPTLPEWNEVVHILNKHLLANADSPETYIAISNIVYDITRIMGMGKVKS